jgi:hypothetical protein
LSKDMGNTSLTGGRAYALEGYYRVIDRPRLDQAQSPDVYRA